MILEVAKSYKNYSNHRGCLITITLQFLVCTYPTEFLRKFDVTTTYVLFFTKPYIDNHFIIGPIYHFFS